MWPGSTFANWPICCSPRFEAADRSKIKTATEALGLSNVTAAAEVWGLDGDNFVNKTLVALDGDPRGLLRLILDRSLKPADLARIPRDASFAMAFRLDLQQALDIVLATAEKAGNQSTSESLKQLGAVETSLGIDLRRGLFRGLGDTWCIYDSRSEGNLFTAVAPLRDAAAMKITYGP